MRIKNFKMFLESATEKYLDADHFFYSYFINFYDEGYTFKLTKGWIDRKKSFRILSPGVNRKLGYKLNLINEEFSRVDLSEKISNAIQILEFDGYKVYKENSSEIVLETNITVEITIDDICNEYPFITKENYIKANEFIKEQLNNYSTKIINKNKIWYNDKEEWLIQHNLKDDVFYIQYERIWSFFESNFKYDGYDASYIQIIIRIILESNLNIKVDKAYTTLFLAL